jgi:5-methylcytosine-specific restriction endonuclease McrA
MSALRRAQWPAKYASIATAFVKDGINPKTGKPCKLHRCPECKELLPKGKMHADHIVPIVPLTGFDSWDNVIARLYCEIEGFKPLCKPCHSVKTKIENQERRANKNKNPK